MRPICVPCQRYFKPKKNDFWFTESMPAVDEATPGKESPEHWKPYKIWAADLYECPGCKAQILSGFAREPLREHYELDFKDMRVKLKATQFQVNDC